MAFVNTKGKSLTNAVYTSFVVIIWISIAFGLMIGFYQKVKTNVAKTELNDFVSCKIG